VWGEEFREQRAAANLEYRIRFQSDVNYCRGLSDNELREFRKTQPFNHAAYEEQLRREKRTERWRALRNGLITLVVIAVIVLVLANMRVKDALEAVVVWGLVGLLFVGQALGWGRGDPK
jgi:hypothetical protein